MLSRIRPEHYASIGEYRREMLEAGDSLDGCASLEKYEDIEKWHLNTILFEREDTVPPGYSIGFEYVYLCNDEVAGMVNLRPEAESHPYLKRYGGHIGYSVRPSMRNRGIATRMLKEVLDICRSEYRLKRVLVTCNEDNEGSRRVILNNGGVLENRILYPPEGKMIERYWISL